MVDVVIAAAIGRSRSGPMSRAVSRSARADRPRPRRAGWPGSARGRQLVCSVGRDAEGRALVSSVARRWRSRPRVPRRRRAHGPRRGHRGARRGAVLRHRPRRRGRGCAAADLTRRRSAPTSSTCPPTRCSASHWTRRSARDRARPRGGRPREPRPGVGRHRCSPGVAAQRCGSCATRRPTCCSRRRPKPRQSSRVDRSRTRRARPVGRRQARSRRGDAPCARGGRLQAFEIATEPLAVGRHDGRRRRLRCRVLVGFLTAPGGRERRGRRCCEARSSRGIVPRRATSGRRAKELSL